MRRLGSMHLQSSQQGALRGKLAAERGGGEAGARGGRLLFRLPLLRVVQVIQPPRQDGYLSRVVGAKAHGNS